jgi:hypothetical protein
MDTRTIFKFLKDPDENNSLEWIKGLARLQNT